MISITDRNGMAHECFAEAFGTTFNVLILVCPVRQPAWLLQARALNWQAVFLPKGTPQPIVKFVNESFTAALAKPIVQERLATLGQTIFSPEMQTLSTLARFQQAEIQKWWPIVREANLKAE